jgi:hypothetical protein
MYAALGKDGQIINVVPSENLVIIRMGEAPGTSLEVTPVYNNDIWKKLNDLTCNVSTIENQNQFYIMGTGKHRNQTNSNVGRIQ